MGNALLNRALAFALGALLLFLAAPSWAQAPSLALTPPALATPAQPSPNARLLGHPLALDPALAPPNAPTDGPRGVAEGADPEAEQAPDDDQAPDDQAPDEDPRNRRKVYNGAYLLYFYQHDPADQETFFHILGLFWHRDNPRWTLNVVAPLVGHWRWKEQPEHYGFATPLLWHHDAPDFTYTGAWLWHTYEDPQTRFDLLFPIYWRFYDRAQEDDLHIVGPAFWRQRRERWDAGLLPLFWTSGTPDELQWTLLPLLLFYEDSPLTTKLISPLFLHVEDHTDDIGRGGVPLALTYWSVDRANEEDLFIQFPLFLQYRNHRDRSTLRFLTPLAFGYEEEPTYEGEAPLRFSTLFPLYFGLDDRDESFRLFLPLLYARADAGDDFRFRMMGPLYSWRDGEDTSWGLWPLFTFAQQWHDTDEDGQGDALSESTRLLPLFYAHDSPWQTRRFFLPLLYGHVHTPGPDGGYTWRNLGPLFSSRSAQAAWSGLFPLLWLYENTQEAQEREDTLLFPLYYAHDSAQRSTRLLAPLLYFRDKDETQDYRALVAGPFYDVRQGEDWDVGLAPLFFHRERPREGSRLTLVPGLYLHRETPDSLTQQWGPSWRHEDPQTRAWGVFPLLAYEEDLRAQTWGVFSLPGIYASAGPQRFHLLLGPLWSFQDGQDLSQGLFPLAMQVQRADGSGWRWLPGFLDIEQAGAEPWRLTWFLTGLRYHAPGDRAFSMVAPLYVHHEDLALGQWGLWAFPWVFASGDDDGALSVTAPPFLYERGAGSTFWSVLPLAFGGSSPDTSWWLVAPLALRHTQTGDDPHDLLLGPLLFGRYREGSQDQLGQASARDLPDGSDTGWVGPYVWSDDRRSRLRLLAPLLWGYDDFEAGESTFVLFPLRLRWERTDGELWRQLEAWTPLYWRYQERLAGQELAELGALGPFFSYEGSQGSGFGLFPLFWHDRLRTPQGDRGHDIAFPLVWSFFDERDDSRSTFVGPFYATRKGTSSRAGLVPLYFRAREEQDGWSEGYDAVFPLLWSSFERGSGVDNATIATPVGFHQRQSGQTRGLWLNYYYSREPDRSLDVVAPLFWRETTPELTRTALLPLFYRSESHLWNETWTWAGPYVGHRSDNLDLDLLFPLYYQERESDGSHLRLAPLFWDQRWGRTDERFTLVGPAWRWRDPRNDSTTLGLFPLAWWTQAPDHTQSALLPLWFGDFREDGHLASAAGLFWSWSSRWGQHEDGGWIAGPLYHTYAQTPSQSTSGGGLFPLAHWEQSSDGAAQGWLLPVAYYDRDPQEGRRTVIAGPLFFHEDAQQDRDWWGVAPLLWGFRSGQDSGSALFPLYYHEGRAQGHTFVSPIAASWRQDDDYARWFLLYGAGGDERGSWQGLFPLFYGSQAADGAGVKVVVPLYAQWQSAAAQSGGKVLFPLYWSFYDRPAQEEATVLFPLYWNFSDPKRDLTLVLPWFYSERKDVQRVTHGLVPLYYYSEDKYGYTFQLLGGLYGVDHVHKTQESDYQLLWIPF